MTAAGSAPEGGAAPTNGPTQGSTGSAKAAAAGFSAGNPAGTPPAGSQTGGDTPPDDGESTIPNGDTAAQIAHLESELEKWRGLARKHEDRSRQNAKAASQTQTLEQQIAELQSAMAERDTRDAERNVRLAMSEVRTQIAAAGVKPADVSDLLELVDPARLMGPNGEPDEASIAKVAASITRTGGRPQPDPDQGKKGETGRPSMDAMIRRAAGVHS
jgi:hypothetical protein